MSNYFDDQIAAGKPIVPPTTPTIQEAEVVSQPSEWQGLPVRAGGDRVFLLKDGKSSWITSKEVLERLGFTFADVVKIDQATLSVIPEGDPIR